MTCCADAIGRRSSGQAFEGRRAIWRRAFLSGAPALPERIGISAITASATGARVLWFAALQKRIALMLGNSYLNQPKHLGELLHAMKVKVAEDARGAAQPQELVRRPA